MKHIARWLLLSALPAFPALAGCGYSTTSTGRFVSDATVAQLSPGKTDADWVQVVLGDPDERRRGPGEGQTWIWHNRRTRVEHTPGAKTEWIERDTFVALTADGRIERTWIEENSSPGWAD